MHRAVRSCSSFVPANRRTCEACFHAGGTQCGQPVRCEPALTPEAIQTNQTPGWLPHERDHAANPARRPEKHIKIQRKIFINHIRYGPNYQERNLMCAGHASQCRAFHIDCNGATPASDVLFLGGGTDNRGQRDDRTDPMASAVARTVAAMALSHAIDDPSRLQSPSPGPADTLLPTITSPIVAGTRAPANPAEMARAMGCHPNTAFPAASAATGPMPVWTNPYGRSAPRPFKQLKPPMVIRSVRGNARRKAATSLRVAAKRAIGRREPSPSDCVPPPDAADWINDGTDNTRPPESDPALLRPAFYCAFSDFDTWQEPTGGNTDSTSDSGDRTRGGTRCRYVEPLPTNHPSSGGEGGIGSHAPH